MIRKILKKLKSDNGSSAMVSFLFLVPLFLSIVITSFDMGFYFSNRGQVEGIARDAARTVAIFGGNGTSTTATTLEKSYGNSRSQACSRSREGLSGSPAQYAFDQIVNSNSTPIECEIAYNLALNGGLTNVSFNGQGDGVKCGPEVSKSIGSRTYCSINYTYGGLPGSSLGFVKLRHDDGTVSSPLEVNRITKSSEAEVQNPAMTSR